MTSHAHALVPKRLDPEIRELAVGFMDQVRERVAEPLFHPSASQLDPQVAMLWGANLVARFNVVVTQAGAPFWRGFQESVGDMLADLRERATEMLGAEQAFKLLRALQMLESINEQLPVALHRFARPDLALHVGVADLVEVNARHEALLLAWILVLVGEVPPPEDEVAHEVAGLFLRLSAERASLFAALLESRHQPAVEHVDGDFQAIQGWLGDHPELGLPFITALGMAAGTRGVEAVRVGVVWDPEDETQSWLQVGAAVPSDDYDRVDDQLAHRWGRSGMAACAEDNRGGQVLLMAEPT
jgi:hypothetical protein